jgi:putative chitinase
MTTVCSDRMKEVTAATATSDRKCAMKSLMEQQGFNYDAETDSVFDDDHYSNDRRLGGAGLIDISRGGNDLDVGDDRRLVEATTYVECGPSYMKTGTWAACDGYGTEGRSTQNAATNQCAVWPKLTTKCSSGSNDCLVLDTLEAPLNTLIADAKAAGQTLYGSKGIRVRATNSFRKMAPAMRFWDCNKRTVKAASAACATNTPANDPSCMSWGQSNGSGGWLDRFGVDCGSQSATAACPGTSNHMSGIAVDVSTGVPNCKTCSGVCKCGSGQCGSSGRYTATTAGACDRGWDTEASLLTTGAMYMGFPFHWLRANSGPVASGGSGWKRTVRDEPWHWEYRPTEACTIDCDATRNAAYTAASVQTAFDNSATGVALNSDCTDLGKACVVKDAANSAAGGICAARVTGHALGKNPVSGKCGSNFAATFTCCDIPAPPGPTPAPTPVPAAFDMVKADHECNSADEFLGTYDTLEKCAQKCAGTSGCYYFIYGKGLIFGGRCYWEKTATETCSEGWDSDSYDFLKLGGTAPTPSPVASGAFVPAAPDTTQNSGTCTTAYQQFAGHCINVAKCTGGTFKGLCSGSSSTMCCVAETNGTPVQTPPQMTLATFKTVFEGISATRAEALYPYFLTALTDGPLSSCHEIAAFVAQIGHESHGLLYFEELASGAAYNGRTDLGNTQAGDGPRFKGRGPIQLTGRANYAAAGTALGMDFEARPEQVSLPSAGFKAAVWFWTNKNLNQYCTGKASDFTTLTQRINGGQNGAADRVARWGVAKNLLQCGAPTSCSIGGRRLMEADAEECPCGYFWDNGQFDADGNKVCTWVSDDCSEGFFEDAEATETSDRICTACEAYQLKSKYYVRWFYR